MLNKILRKIEFMIATFFNLVVKPSKNKEKLIKVFSDRFYIKFLLRNFTVFV